MDTSNWVIPEFSWLDVTVVHKDTLSIKDKQIAELVDMLNVIWEDWSCDDCPEGEKMEELIHKYNKDRMSPNVNKW